MATKTFKKGSAARVHRMIGVSILCAVGMIAFQPAYAEVPKGLPAEVPADLSGPEYLNLGKRYKGARMPDKAREALNLAIEKDPAGAGKEAQVYIKGYLPKGQVPPDAQKLNALAYKDYIHKNWNGSIKAYTDCIKKYPGFEWPYTNLAYIYMTRKQNQDAKNLLNRALAINPNYVNAWVELAKIYIDEKDAANAGKCLQNALQVDAQNREAQYLQVQVATLPKKPQS